MVDVGCILYHIINYFNDGIIWFSQKLASIDGDIEKKRLVTIGPLQHLKSDRYAIDWMQKGCIYVQTSLGPGIGLQSTVMKNGQRFII